MRCVLPTRVSSKSSHLDTPCLSSHTVIWWVLPTQRKRQRQWLLRSRLLTDQMMKVRCSPGLVNTVTAFLNLTPMSQLQGSPIDELFCQACHNGQNYVFALLTGYRDPPTGISIREGLHYNPYFPGGATAMPKMLSDEDRTPVTKAHVSFFSAYYRH
ncbi:hypothetical protein Rs2_37115 [Raphanus sativus]|nr:hypothetical protein Rs2_37115 [Raphanus sativus]